MFKHGLPSCSVFFAHAQGFRSCSSAFDEADKFSNVEGSQERNPTSCCQLRWSMNRSSQTARLQRRRHGERPFVPVDLLCGSAHLLAQTGGLPKGCRAQRTIKVRLSPLHILGSLPETPPRNLSRRLNTDGATPSGVIVRLVRLDMLL